MQHPFKVLSIVLATALCASIAQQSVARGHMIRSFDANADGKVTRQEFESGSVSKFGKMDANQDGTVNSDEFNAYMKEKHKEMGKNKRAAMDTNADGFISKDEFVKAKQEKALRRFDRMDKDGDDQLSEEELNSHHGRHKKGPHGKKHHKANHIFKRMDANNDGIVTQQENAASWGQWFDKIDVNNDDTLTSEELEQMKVRGRDHD